MTERPIDVSEYEGEFLDIAGELVNRAGKNGADQADVFVQWGTDSEVQVRLRDIEAIKQSSSKGLGLRVFKGNKLGFASSTDLSKNSLELLLGRAFQLSDVSGEDNCLGLHDKQSVQQGDLAILDDTCLKTDINDKISFAMEMENAALDYDTRIRNSEGSVYRDSVSGTILINSLGFSNIYYRSMYSMVCQPVAQVSDEKRVNYWYSSATHFSGLEAPREIGETAASRAVRMLGAEKIKTTRIPVVLDPLTASGFIGTIMKCVNGELKYKSQTCYCNSLDECIAGDDITILDDGILEKGLGTSPVDGEGVRSRRKTIVEKGVLKSFLYDTYSSRKDKTAPTGNGFRSYQSLPAVSGTNFYLENGNETTDSIIKSIEKGIYITGLIGFGINIVNGDYSRGAEGILIENGELTKAVDEITISGNIMDMLKGISSRGNDLVFRGRVSSPSILIDEMVISGI